MAAVSSAVRTVKSISHQDRLTLIEHLDELRSRLIFCVATLVIVFGICLWQNDALLNILNKPLAQTTAASIKKGEGLPGQINKNRVAVLGIANSNLAMARILASPSSGLPAPTRARIAAQAIVLQQDIKGVPKQTEGNKPVTLRVGEPFSTSLMVSLYFALLFSLPILLYQLYAFVLPAFTPKERNVAVPLMGMVPVLFIAGVVFGYYVVLPPAVQFLQNFNADQFNILVQASDYYKFAVLALISLGVLFQMPVGILAAVKMGIVTPKQLAKNRRYALLAIAVVAMLLPGTDPVTMLISMVPLIFLYEFSIILARIFAKPKAAETDESDAVDDVGLDEPLPAEEQIPVTVGGDWDEGEGGASVEDDDWQERPPRRDGGGDSTVS